VEKGSMMIAVRCDMGESVLTLFTRGEWVNWIIIPILVVCERVCVCVVTRIEQM